MNDNHFIYTNLLDFELDLVGLTERFNLVWLHTDEPQKLPNLFKRHPVLAIRSFVDPFHLDWKWKDRKKGNYLVMTDEQTGDLPNIPNGKQIKIPFSELDDYGISNKTIVFMLLQQRQCFVRNGVFANPHPFSRLIVALPNWKKQNKQRTLEIELTKNSVLKLVGRTYTEKKVTSEDKWSFQVEKATGCIYPSDHSEEHGLVQVNHGKRQSVDFLSITEENVFFDTKIGVIYELMTWLRNSRFEDCFKSVPSLRPYPLTHYTKTRKDQNKDLTDEIISGKTIFVYADKDTTSQHLAKKIVNAINISRVDIEACYSEKKQPGLNIQVVRDVRDSSDKVDGYQKNQGMCVIQHITVENFGENEEKTLSDLQVDFLQKDKAMIKILQELVIKQDIALRTLRMVPKDELEYLTPYSFYYLDWDTSKKKPKSEWTVTIGRLKIDINGGMEFKKSHLPFLNSNSENLDELQQIGAAVIQQYRNKYYQVLGVVQLNQTLYVVCNTSLMTLPAVEDIHKQLVLASPRRLVSRTQLLEIAVKLKLDRKYMDSQSKLTSLLENIVNEKLSVAQLLIEIKSAHMNWKMKVLSEFNKDVHSKLGFWLHPSLRSKKNQEYWNRFMGSGLLSINGLPHYFVATNSPLKNNFRKAIRLKRIDVIGDSDMRDDEQVKLHFADFQRMMQVTFVRNGQSTVVPFPLKYLREYLAEYEES